MANAPETGMNGEDQICEDHYHVTDSHRAQNRVDGRPHGLSCQHHNVADVHNCADQAQTHSHIQMYGLVGDRETLQTIQKRALTWERNVESTLNTCSHASFADSSLKCYIGITHHS